MVVKHSHSFWPPLLEDRAVGGEFCVEVEGAGVGIIPGRPPGSAPGPTLDCAWAWPISDEARTNETANLTNGIIAIPSAVASMKQLGLVSSRCSDAKYTRAC
jgi:hypothetical protein